jgi:hypothetical protein
MASIKHATPKLSKRVLGDGPEGCSLRCGTSDLVLIRLMAVPVAVQQSPGDE